MTGISDREARRIASDWHSSGGSALYALSSTGSIDTACGRHCTGYSAFKEINDSLDFINTYDGSYIYPESDVTDLYNLLTYVIGNGPRGPVDGWSHIPWD